MEIVAIILLWGAVGLVARIMFFMIIQAPASTYPRTLTLTQAVPNIYKRILVNVLTGPYWWIIYLVIVGAKKSLDWIVKP